MFTGKNIIANLLASVMRSDHLFVAYGVSKILADLLIFLILAPKYLSAIVSAGHIDRQACIARWRCRRSPAVPIRRHLPRHGSVFGAANKGFQRLRDALGKLNAVERAAIGWMNARSSFLSALWDR
jgi:hypothetical protein